MTRVEAIRARSLEWLTHRSAHIEMCGDCRREIKFLEERGRGEQPTHCFVVRTSDDAAAMAGLVDDLAGAAHNVCLPRSVGPENTVAVPLIDIERLRAALARLEG